MPNPRKEIITTGEIYHIFNRSIANEEIFCDKYGIRHILELLDFYRFSQPIRFSKYKLLSIKQKSEYIAKFETQNPLVKIYAYALMPTHFHLLLKQMVDNGIKNYLSNIQNGYAKYYNLLKDRKGGLFQSPFKAKRVATDNEFLHVSRYIHLNPVTSYILNFEKLTQSNITSLPFYLSKETNNFVSTNKLLNLSGSSEKYLKFIEKQIDVQRSLNNIKHLLID